MMRKIGHCNGSQYFTYLVGGATVTPVMPGMFTSVVKHVLLTFQDYLQQYVQSFKCHSVEDRTYNMTCQYSRPEGRPNRTVCMIYAYFYPLIIHSVKIHET